MNFKNKFSLLWKLNKVSNAVEKITVENPNFSWSLAVRKGLTTFGWAALGYIATEFSSEMVLAAAMGEGLPMPVKLSLASLLAGVFKTTANYAKNRRLKLDVPSQGAGGAALGVLLALSLLSSPVTAQEATPSPTATPVAEASPTPLPVPVYSPACADSLNGCQFSLSVDTGLMQFGQRGSDHKDFVHRLNVSVKVPNKMKLEGRADWTRTQDGGNLFDPKTFKSLEGWLAVTRPVVYWSDTLALDIMGISGVTWNRDKEFNPEDPRLWTVGLCGRLRVREKGNAIQCIAHHGPTGGLSSLTSVTYNLGSERSWWFGDVAVPLSSVEFLKNPYTFRFGIAGTIHITQKGN